MANFENYQRMFQTPNWFDLEEVGFMEDFFGFEVDSFAPAFQVAGAIGAVEALGLISARVEHVFEFGSGDGPGLIALDLFAKSRPGDTSVIGSELSFRDRRVASKIAELLETVKAIEEDGFEVLEGPQEFDVIVANMFGSLELDLGRVERFVPLAISSLTKGGVAIINSDIDNMYDVQAYAKAELEHDQFRSVCYPDELPDGFICMPHVVLLG